MKRKGFLMVVLLFLVCILLCSCEKVISVIGAAVDENGNLILTMSDGTTQSAGNVKGIQGLQGIQGAQGVQGIPGENGAQGEQGITPMLQINASSGMWEVSYDNGATWQSLGVQLYDAQGLEFLLLPNDTYTVMAGKAIYSKEIIIPATYNGKSVSTIGIPQGMDVYGIKEDFDESLTPLLGFFGLPNLTKVRIPNSVTYIGVYAFAECEKLTEVVFEENSALQAVGKSAFEECHALTDIVLPASTTKIGDRAFYYCERLENFELPSTVAHVGNLAFHYCNLLISVENNIKYVGKWVVDASPSIINATLRSDTVGVAHKAFMDCIQLTDVYIPASVKYIDEYSFLNCRNISNIIVEQSNATYRMQGEDLIHTETGKVLIRYGKGSLVPDDVVEDPFW